MLEFQGTFYMCHLSYVLAMWPAQKAFEFAKKPVFKNAFERLNKLPQASAYASRERVPTAIIAATTAAEISDELTSLYRDSLSPYRRELFDAQNSSVDSSVLPASMFARAEPEVVAAPVVRQGQLDQWEFPENEVDAAAFNIFKTRLSETQEYLNRLSKPALVERMDTLVEAMRQSPSLRGTCFTIASDAIERCGDRVALGLNDMEQARMSKDAESGKLGVVELFHTGVGFFKKKVLDDIAMTKINKLKNRYLDMDQIEIRLAYPTELCERLALPGVTRSMLYRASAEVSLIEIAAAERQVRAKLKRGDAIDFLAKWQPWCIEMQRRNLIRFRQMSHEIEMARAVISIKPDDMTDQQWLDALAVQKMNEETAAFDFVKDLTTKYIAQHRLTMA